MLFGRALPTGQLNVGDSSENGRSHVVQEAIPVVRVEIAYAS
jgi:hypothetical protein